MLSRQNWLILLITITLVLVFFLNNEAQKPLKGDYTPEIKPPTLQRKVKSDVERLEERMLELKVGQEKILQKIDECEQHVKSTRKDITYISLIMNGVSNKLVDFIEAVEKNQPKKK